MQLFEFCKTEINGSIMKIVVVDYCSLRRSFRISNSDYIRDGNTDEKKVN